MDKINTEFLQRCIEVLERSYESLKNSDESSIEYEMFRNSLVKSFEMTLEQAGKLLKKKITPYLASKKAADALIFKDIFRYAAKHALLTDVEAERWLQYRDNRNSTTHDYGEIFAQKTLTLMDDFLLDAKRLKEIIE
ncbi:MAG: nucleotidyltransferase substrate binding protein [Deferribacteraceae bacterium]|jgi:nucleotidyltransferase substrate binding protein (TIGR01987 family)|nr:nucleotidyltransferase substrate binding protein [Deferribacteraceae bacterium]